MYTLKPVFRHHCKRCGHLWNGYKEIPGTCANQKCRSPFWDLNRVRAVSKNKKPEIQDTDVEIKQSRYERDEYSS